MGPSHSAAWCRETRRGSFWSSRSHNCFQGLKERVEARSPTLRHVLPIRFERCYLHSGGVSLASKGCDEALKGTLRIVPHIEPWFCGIPSFKQLTCVLKESSLAQ